MCDSPTHLVVMLPSNEHNSGHPDTRSYRVNADFIMNDAEEFAADMIEWLAANGIQAKVVTVEQYEAKLQNYNERVAAAS